MVIDHNFFMNLALEEAWKYQGLTYPNPAVGCCIVNEKNQILAIEAHKKVGLPHAEVEALKTGYVALTNDRNILELENSSDIHQYLINNHNDIFENVSLYTTLEPCSHKGKTPSCADLIISLGIKKVYVGTHDFNEEAAQGAQKILASGTDVMPNILKEKCEQLLEPFRLWHKERFVFFKWAQRLDGTIDDGIITSKESRKNVHAIRDCCDLLVIGGNTVRIDRPTLDARLVDGQAPDVLILSSKKEFDKSIPLFSVPNRKVFIESDLSKMNEYKNIMIEGTESMYNASKEYINWYLCYIAPKFGGEQIMTIDQKLQMVHSSQIKNDMRVWMKGDN